MESDTHQTSEEHGIGLIEILVVSTMLVLVILGVGQLVALGSRLIETAANRHEAFLYAQEGIEAVKNLRNRSWVAEIAPLTPGTTHYPVVSTAPSRWQLTITDPGALYGRPQDFRRTVVLNRVFRDDATDDIVSSGCGGCTEDTDSREVIVAMTWSDRGGNRTLTATSYLTNLYVN